MLYITHLYQGDIIRMKSQWITHQGKRIFFCDYRDLDADSFKQEVAEAGKIICQEPEDSVLVLADVSGTTASPETVDALKKGSAQIKKHAHKSAAVGVGYSGARKVLFDLAVKFSGQDVVLFEDIEKAKDWLVQN